MEMSGQVGQWVKNKRWFGSGSDPVHASVLQSKPTVSPLVFHLAHYQLDQLRAFFPSLLIFPSWARITSIIRKVYFFLLFLSWEMVTASQVHTENACLQISLHVKRNICFSDNCDHSLVFILSLCNCINKYSWKTF